MESKARVNMPLLSLLYGLGALLAAFPALADNREATLKARAGAKEPSSFEYDTDRPGGNYRNFQLFAADPAACAQVCRDEKQCKAWTYIKPGAKGTPPRCLLKNKVPDPVPAEFAVSGVRTVPSRKRPGKSSIFDG